MSQGARAGFHDWVPGGTYLDSPYHRYAGDDSRFGSPSYAEDAHFLTGAGAAGHEPALVGIDAVNIDNTTAPLRIEGFGTIPVRAFARLTQ